MLRHHLNKLDFVSQDFFKMFKRRNKTSDITMPTYTLIIRTFFELAVTKIINDAFRLKLPQFGLFYLVKTKQKIGKDKAGKVRVYGSINWKATKELIKETGDKSRKVYYLNDHTNRHVYTILWDKYMVDFTNKTFYTFAINKKHRQALNYAILNSDKPLNAYEIWYR